jgi:hypothetical protein
MPVKVRLPLECYIALAAACSAVWCSFACMDAEWIGVSATLLGLDWAWRGYSLTSRLEIEGFNARPSVALTSMPTEQRVHAETSDADSRVHALLKHSVLR